MLDGAPELASEAARSMLTLPLLLPPNYSHPLEFIPSPSGVPSKQARGTRETIPLHVNRANFYYMPEPRCSDTA